MKSYKLCVVICTLLLIGSILAGLMIGTYRVGLGDILKMFTGEMAKMVRIVIFNLRLPRICLAVIVGIALSASGCILQTITKNELAEPGIIGINAGAALAVTIVITLSTGYYYENIDLGTLYLVPVAAMFGAVFTTALIYLLSYRRGGVSPVRLLLVGIGINSAVNALITLYQLNMSKGDYNQVLTWISGSLWGTGWEYVWISGPVVAVLFGVVFYKAKTLDVIGLGDVVALSLGVRVEKERRLFLLLAVALAGAATAVAGNIAFLGILGPQLAARMTGASHRRKLPIGAMVSSIIIVLADTASRNLFTPLEIPVGITISIIGVPYFIYLMARSK